MAQEQIKVGDKVRVSKDAPEMYFFGYNYDNSVCKVILVDRDNAVITQVKNGSFAIPTKYLIKVDAEAKEQKFKIGDKVRIKPNAKDFHQGYQNGYFGLHSRDKYVGNVYRIKDIWKRFNAYILDLPELMAWDDIDLEPYTEQKEQTETEKNDADNIVDNLAKAMEDYRNVFANIADNFDWQRYEVDLAKEIAVKLAGSTNFRDAKEKAAYVVQYASEIVENLKKK